MDNQNHYNAPNVRDNQDNQDKLGNVNVDELSIGDLGISDLSAFGALSSLGTQANRSKGIQESDNTTNGNTGSQQ